MPIYSRPNYLKSRQMFRDPDPSRNGNNPVRFVWRNRAHDRLVPSPLPTTLRYEEGDTEAGGDLEMFNTKTRSLLGHIGAQCFHKQDCLRPLARIRTQMANSSPPTRPANPTFAERMDRPFPNARMTRSPVAWPNLSLIDLKWSRSHMMKHAGTPRADELNMSLILLTEECASG